MFDVGDWKIYKTPGVIEEMPVVYGWSGDPYFFSLDYSPTPRELDREYELRRLVPDPIGLSVYARKYPESFRSSPYMCQWRDMGWVFYAAFFYRIVGPGLNEPAVLLLKESAVIVARVTAQLTDRWSRQYRFAGVPGLTPAL